MITLLAIAAIVINYNVTYLEWERQETLTCYQEACTSTQH